MSTFQSRYERLELKYLLDEREAAQVLRDIEPYCARDAYARDASGSLPGYRVRSLYLDSPGLAFHRAKERGDPVRIKLRIRRYEGSDTACFELKRRVGDVVEKQRALVPRSNLEAAAKGAQAVVAGGALAQETLEEHAKLALQSGAGPTLLVDYRRDAYLSDVDHYARVTLDRDIAFQRTHRWDFEAPTGHWLRLDEHVSPEKRPVVVLELKCTTAVPLWLMQLVQDRQLRRSSVSKYSLGIYTSLRTEELVRGQERARELFR